MLEVVQREIDCREELCGRSKVFNVFLPTKSAYRSILWRELQIKL